MTKPLIVYLDTQDYSNLCNIKTDEMLMVYNYLCNKVDKGEIIIPYSYFIVAELLTDFTDNYKEDRLRRVTVVKRLCKTNTFRFIDRDMSFKNALSKDGYWYTKFEPWDHLKKAIQEQTIQIIEALPKNVAIKINQKKPWPQLFKLFPTLTKSISKAASLLPVPKSFSESHLLVRHLKGEISEEVIKAESEKILTDLNMFFNFWFENDANKNVKFLQELIRTAGKPFIKLANDFIAISLKAKEQFDLINEIAATNNGLDSALKQEFKTVKNTFREYQKLDLNFVKSFIPEKSILDELPSHFTDTILLYAIGITNGKKKLQDSDAGDIMHACYLPYCDIWRGDKKFCNLLVEMKVDGYHKAVKLLTELPSVIESKINVKN